MYSSEYDNIIKPKSSIKSKKTNDNNKKILTGNQMRKKSIEDIKICIDKGDFVQANVLEEKEMKR